MLRYATAQTLNALSTRLLEIPFQTILDAVRHELETTNRGTGKTADDYLKRLRQVAADLRQLAQTTGSSSSTSCRYEKSTLTAKPGAFKAVVNSSRWLVALGVPLCRVEEDVKGSFFILDQSPDDSEFAGCMEVGQLILRDFQVLCHDPRGLEFETLVREGQCTLPEDLQKIKDELLARSAELRNQKLTAPHNGRRYCITRIGCDQRSAGEERTIVQMELIAADYYDFLATVQSLGRPLPCGQTVWSKYYQRFATGDVLPIPHDEPYLFPSLGINLAVLTSDDNLLIPKRSSKVVTSSVYNSSVNEGLKFEDVDEAGEIDFSITAIRGLFEELGIVGNAQDLKITSLGFVKSFMQFALLGHIRVDKTWNDIRQALPVAQDASLENEYKHGKFTIARITPPLDEGIAAFLRSLPSSDSRITSFGLATLLIGIAKHANDLISMGHNHFSDPMWSSLPMIHERSPTEYFKL